MKRMGKRSEERGEKEARGWGGGNWEEEGIGRWGGREG